MKNKTDCGKAYAYLELYRALRGGIVNGAYVYGDKLPSKRVLAEETGCSVVTVEHAYALLCEEGYAESREKSGYYVAFRSAEFLGNADCGDYYGSESASECGGVLRCADGSRCCGTARQNFGADFTFPFSVLAKTMRKVLSDRGEELLVKAPNGGIAALRLALSRYLARSRGIFVLPEQIVIGSGAEYLYGQIVSMLGRVRIYAAESPSYQKILQVYRACGVKCETLPLGADGIESSALNKTRATVLHVTPYRSFPSGVTASASKRAEYVRWANEGDRYVVEDDYDSEFAAFSKPTETLFGSSGGERVIYLNTFSETISGAMRVGYMVLPQSLMGAYREKVGFYACPVPVFEQYVLAELLDGGEFERHVHRVRRALRKSIKVS